MGITLLGVVTVLLSIYAFFKNEKLLLYMLVFLSTFTAAEVFHIEWIGMPVLTFEYIGAIWLLRQLINFIKSKPKFSKEKIISKLKENKLAIAFMIFLAVIIIGEIYIIISGLTINYTKLDGEENIIKFGFGNIKQLMIVGFILVLMIVLSYKIKTKEEIQKLIKIFAISTVFAVLWGFFQFIIYYLNIPYPDFLFNNNPYAAQYYMQADNNVKRISSIALEPSMFAINLICFMPFALGAFLQTKGKLKEKKNMYIFIMLVLTTACAILTTSSTTYVRNTFCLWNIWTIYSLWIYKSWRNVR